MELTFDVFLSVDLQMMSHLFFEEDCSDLATISISSIREFKIVTK